MSRFSLSLLALAILWTAVIAQPEPQPPPKGKSATPGQKKSAPAEIAAAPTPTPIIVVILNYIGDANLTTELKLTPEQLKKLTDYRQKVWDETYATAPAERAKTAEARVKASEAILKETLTPAQQERARQLAARLGRTRVNGGALDADSISSRFLATHPELVEVVKLTDEQKKNLTPQPVGGTEQTGYFRIRLSPEQLAAWDKFIGPPPAQPVALVTDPRAVRRTFTIPADFTLVRVRDIQNELKLTEDQLKAVTALSQKYADRIVTGTPADVSPKDRDKQQEELLAETNKFMSTGLKPEQIARLRQITFQRSQNLSTRDVFLRNAEVAKALGLNEAQLKQLDGIPAVWEAEVVKAFETDQPYEATKKAVDAANTGRTDKAVAVLTPDQSAKAKDMLGVPYTGNYTTSTFGGPGNGGFPGSRGTGDLPSPSVRSDLTRAWSEFGFGKHMLDLSHIARLPDLQTELKMTPEQIQKAQTTYSNILDTTTPGGIRNSDDYLKQIETRATAYQKAVTEILTADQQKRLRQVMIQIMEAPTAAGNIYGRFGAAAYPGVAEEIKLTPEQKKKLFDGTTPANVLTADQKTAIKNLSGEPYKGQTTLPAAGPRGDRGTAGTFRPNGGRPGGTTTPGGTTPAGDFRGRGGPAALPARVRLLAGTTLDAALKITAEQKKSVAAAAVEYQKGLTTANAEFRPGSESMAKATAALNEKLEAALTAVFPPEQRKRLDQLVIQSEAADSFPAVLRQPAISKKLEISPEQLQKITAAVADDEQTATLLAAQPLTAVKRSDLAAKLRDRSDSHVLALLTDSQQKAWKELTGEPANIRKSPLNFRSAFGGPGGDRGR